MPSRTIALFCGPGLRLRSVILCVCSVSPRSRPAPPFVFERSTVLNEWRSPTISVINLLAIPVIPTSPGISPGPYYRALLCTVWTV